MKKYSKLFVLYLIIILIILLLVFMKCYENFLINNYQKDLNVKPSTKIIRFKAIDSKIILINNNGSYSNNNYVYNQLLNKINQSGFSLKSESYSNNTYLRINKFKLGQNGKDYIGGGIFINPHNITIETSYFVYNGSWVIFENSNDIYNMSYIMYKQKNDIFEEQNFLLTNIIMEKYNVTMKSKIYKMRIGIDYI